VHTPRSSPLSTKKAGDRQSSLVSGIVSKNSDLSDFSAVFYGQKSV
jgi:hypothetical protein